ncbi:MAG: alpha/beta fold hydrolase [Sphingomicrobium sp.]|nr:alpha/beta hydrolase [Sphingomonadales bacterium]
MIEDALGPVDYDESGRGPAILFVPGSCSTGAAWKPVIAALGASYRSITTSLPGYGGSAERRTEADPSIGVIAAAVETVIRHAGGAVHLVGHSFGGDVALAVALRGQVRVRSLTILEAPAPAMLSAFERWAEYDQFRAMTSAYVQEYRSGNAEAIAAMVDFYGGAGTFASWPSAVRRYAVKTTPTNILDWQSAYACEHSAAALAELNLPVLVAVGENSHSAVVEANSLIAKAIPGARFATIKGATHFMIATHARAVADLIAQHIGLSDQPPPRLSR